MSYKNEDAATTQGEEGGPEAGTECPTSAGTGNGYALTDVIDDLMAAEFPETTAPQADAEEVVLLSPTPPTCPPPPPPSEPEVDKPEVMKSNDLEANDTAEDGEHAAAKHYGIYELSSEPEVDKPELRDENDPEANNATEDGEHASAGQQGTHESRVTFSGPLQFMGRNDLPRDDLTPPLSPISSPVKLLDVLPATLKDAAAAEASLARSMPLTSGSIDAVTLDDTPSPWSAIATGTETSHVDDEQDVFNKTPTTVDVDVTGNEDKDQDDVGKTDVDRPGEVELSSIPTVTQSSEPSVDVSAAAAEPSKGVSLLRIV